MKSSVAIIFLLIFVGCSNARYTYKISSFSNQKDLPLKTFNIIPLSNTKSKNSFLFKELSLYVARMMQEKGYKLTSHKEQAELIIKFDYSVSEPREAVTSEYNVITGGMTASSTSLYSRKIVLDAYSNKNNIWRTEILSDGSGNDLRIIVPTLLTLAFELIGTETGQQLTYSNIGFNYENHRYKQIKFGTSK